MTDQSAGGAAGNRVPPPNHGLTAVSPSGFPDAAESSPESSSQRKDGKQAPVAAKAEVKKGFTSLGIAKLSLTTAVAQRDQEFGGRASLPRMEPIEGEEPLTGFYSARGPREFKLNLANNMRFQPPPQVPRPGESKFSVPAGSRRQTTADSGEGTTSKPKSRPAKGTATGKGRPGTSSTRTQSSNSGQSDRKPAASTKRTQAPHSSHTTSGPAIRSPHANSASPRIGSPKIAEHAQGPDAEDPPPRAPSPYLTLSPGRPYSLSDSLSTGSSSDEMPPESPPSISRRLAPEDDEPTTSPRGQKRPKRPSPRPTPRTMNISLSQHADTNDEPPLISRGGRADRRGRAGSDEDDPDDISPHSSSASASGSSEDLTGSSSASSSNETDSDDTGSSGDDNTTSSLPGTKRSSDGATSGTSGRRSKSHSGTAGSLVMSSGDEAGSSDSGNSDEDDELNRLIAHGSGSSDSSTCGGRGSITSYSGRSGTDSKRGPRQYPSGTIVVNGGGSGSSFSYSPPTHVYPPVALQGNFSPPHGTKLIKPRAKPSRAKQSNSTSNTPSSPPQHISSPDSSRTKRNQERDQPTSPTSATSEHSSSHRKQSHRTRHTGGFEADEHNEDAQPSHVRRDDPNEASQGATGSGYDAPNEGSPRPDMDPALGHISAFRRTISNPSAASPGSPRAFSGAAARAVRPTRQSPSVAPSSSSTKKDSAVDVETSSDSSATASTTSSPRQHKSRPGGSAHSASSSPKSSQSPGNRRRHSDTAFNPSTATSITSVITPHQSSIRHPPSHQTPQNQSNQWTKRSTGASGSIEDYLEDDDDEFADPVIEEVYYDESDEARDAETENVEDDAVIALLNQPQSPTTVKSTHQKATSPHSDSRHSHQHSKRHTTSQSHHTPEVDDRAAQQGSVYYEEDYDLDEEAEEDDFQQDSGEEDYEEGEEDHDNEYADGEEDGDHSGEEYDDELEALSLSPGSSAMMMIADAGHGEDLYKPINFDAISVEDLIREHNRNPDLLYMIEVGDPALVNWLCTPDTVKKLAFALCEQFTMLHMEDALTTGRTYEKDVLSSFSYYLITSTPNGALPTYILDNFDLFDLFFSLSTPADFKAPAYWTRVMLFLLSKNTSSQAILAYMNSPLPDLEASLSALSIHPKRDSVSFPQAIHHLNHKTRGQFAISCLLRLSGNDNVARLIAALLFPEESTIPWIQIFTSCHFSTLLEERFDALLQLSRQQFFLQGQPEAANITELVGLIVSKVADTELCRQLQEAKFAYRLVEIVCQKEPHPLASHCLNIMCHLFDISYNNDEYESKRYPPIIAALIDGETGRKNNLTPLASWAWQLDHPTLQAIPPEQLRDPTKQPFGMYRLQLLRSVNSLLKTNYGVLHQEMFKAGLVSSVMDALFRHQQSSLIHLNVADTLGNVLYVERTEWLVEWLAKYDFVEKVANAFQLAAPHLIPSGTRALNGSPVGVSSSNSPPLGNVGSNAQYVPQLVSICVKLDRLAGSNASLQTLLTSTPRWEYVLHTFSEPLSKQYVELSDVSTIRRNAGSMIAF